MDSISIWLGRLGLAHYTGLFESEEIDVPSLHQMTEADLRELGLPMGPRKKILAALKAMTEREISAPVDPTETPPQWRQISVMFCDLVGSSFLTAHLGAEEMRELVDAYRERLSKVITRHGGWVAKYDGDGIMAYFGFPQAHEDDAVRSVRAALQVGPEIGNINAEWSGKTGRKVQTRISIDSGKVVVARLPTDVISPVSDITGEAPIVAARLQELANPGEVLVSHRTHELCEGFFRFEPRGERYLRNVASKVAIYRVVEPTGRLTRLQASATYTPFINREREIDLILNVWQRVSAGSGDIVAVSGEAGIGKSRLVKRVKELLAEESIGSVDLQSSPLVQQTALHPVRSGIRSAMGLVDTLNTQQQTKRLRVIVRRLLGPGPETEDTCGLLSEFLIAETPEGSSDRSTTSEQRRRETLNAVSEIAVAASQRRPLVICLDDAQWLDPTSHDLLEQLFTKLHDQRILVLLTFRSEFEPSWPAAPSILQLKLGRLGATESELIVQSQLSGRDLPNSVQQQIVERCGGVPLFLEEVTKSVGQNTQEPERARFGTTGYSVPASLQQSISARLDRLASVKEVAQISSVLNRTIELDILETLSGLDSEVLKQKMGELENGGVVVSVGGAAGSRYQFKHALVRDAVYESMLARTRRKLHAAAADALLAIRSEAMRRNPEFVAFHYEAAEEWPAAAESWLDAGVRAMDRSETTEAIEHLTRGISLLDHLAVGKESMRIEVNLRASLASALRATKGFAADEVIEHLIVARDVCETLGDQDLMIEVLQGHQSFYHVKGQLDRACTLGKQLLAFASEFQSDTEMSARTIQRLDAHRRLGWTLFWMGRAEEAQSHFRAGLEIFRSFSGDERQLIRIYGDHPGIFTHCNLAWACWYTGDAEVSEEHLQEAIRLADEANHLLSWTYSNSVISTLHVMRLSPEQALAVSETILNSASRTWQPYWNAWTRIQHGWARSQLGDPDGGAEEIQTGITAYRKTGAELVLPIAAGLLADAHLAGGRAASAYRSLRRGLQLTQVTGIHFYDPELLRRLGELQARFGRKPERAEATFTKAITTARECNAYFFELRARVSAIKARGGQDHTKSDLDSLKTLVARWRGSAPNADIEAANALLKRSH